MKFEEVDYNSLSPMMKQYYDIKKDYKNVILFYRLGDFYEMFFEDALLASKILGLTLTGKNAGLEERIPMCGVPHHSAKNYIQKAIDAGYKIAICEQVENPKDVKGIVKREVVEIITKGTITDLEFLNNLDYNYIASIIKYPSSYVVVYADISAGILNATKISDDDNKLFDLILNNNIKEVVMETSIDVELINLLRNIYNVDINLIDEKLEENNPLFDEIEDFKIKDSVKHLLYYLKIKRLKNIEVFKTINILDNDNYLYMDVHTIRNLELFETLRLKERTNSLIWLIDKCKTAMGSRKLKSWILKPLRDKAMIYDRYDKIDTLNEKFLERSTLEKLLNEVYDIERLCGKIISEKANARDLLQLKNSLRVLKDIKLMVNSLNFDYNFYTFDSEVNLLEASISEDPPITIRDGSLIKDGFSKELDELRNIKSSGKDYIAKVQEDARTQTNIPNLKIGYNKVFGYYIEVTKANIDKIDPSLGWTRKQTLVNAERYISPELKEKENMILNAEEKILNLEYELFVDIRNKLKSKSEELLEVSNIISTLDALVSLSISSENLNLVRPTLNDEHRLEIIDGKHPVVEYVNSGTYVENDIIMDENITTLLITGPNMSGKSTFMRQLAITVILAQAGSFVPAKEANLPIFDKIFTRIGASDDLVSGQSTFMVEMKEANNAIENATQNSLILFDELGRGTSTYDGMSLAFSVLEYINKHIKCKTLFSTHYHELTELESRIKSIKNIHVDASETEEGIVFSHKMLDGPSSKSYGINVARLAGMPEELLESAQKYLKKYEQGEVKSFEEQISFSFDDDKSKVEEEIKNINLDNTTPKEALDTLYALKKMID